MTTTLYDCHLREYYVECFDPRISGWYFCSRLRGIERAMLWAAAFREIKRQPSRVREVPDASTEVVPW